MLPLLKGVSRSFYLSIRLLPSGLRSPVTLGYLLARASDTIADAPGLPAAQRLHVLDQFEQAVQSGAAAPEVQATADMSPGEQQLIAALPQCIEWLARTPEADRDDIRTVLGHITRGQKLDIERPTLANADELDEYTYLVAGCVGEFWTKLGFRHLPRFASLPESEMLALGKRYGMALQLINVLRDADADLAIGRRYLPPGESREAWLERAQAGLESGMRYSGALRHVRVRVASALPAIIGARTLALIRTRGAGAKIPRSEVRAMLLRILFTFGSNTGLQREFHDNRGR
jgi:farnesyl-diphosphate farnesyltransferase